MTHDENTIQAAREAAPGEDWQARAKKAEAELTQTQKHLTDANRGAQRNAHANRFLAIKLNEALKRAEKAEADLVAMRESLETKERVHRQDSEALEKRLYAAEAQLSPSRLRPLAEAGFVAACIRQEIADRKWSGPYPFHEIASVMLATALRSLANDLRQPPLPAGDSTNTKDAAR